MLNINKIIGKKDINTKKGKNKLVNKMLIPNIKFNNNNNINTQPKLQPKQHSNKFENKIGSMPFSKVINNISLRSKSRPIKGASVAKQNKWKSFSTIKRNKLRSQYKDKDGDRVPDKFDCEPQNIMAQDSLVGTSQSLWHAGNMPPSETLKKEGRVFGFSDKRFAEGWAKKHDKENIYQFETDDYVLDDKSYSRPTTKGTEMSDNEFIAMNVKQEDLKGASLAKQNEWKEKSIPERNELRSQLPDADGDRVPDEYDCQPDNVMAQDSRQKPQQQNIMNVPVENDASPQVLNTFNNTLMKHPYLINEINKSPLVRIVLDKKQSAKDTSFIVPSTINATKNDKGEDVFNKFSLHLIEEEVDNPMELGHELAHAQQLQGVTGREFDPGTNPADISDPIEYAAEMKATKDYLNSKGIYDQNIIQAIFDHSEGVMSDKEYEDFERNYKYK